MQPKTSPTGNYTYTPTGCCTHSTHQEHCTATHVSLLISPEKTSEIVGAWTEVAHDAAPYSSAWALVPPSVLHVTVSMVYNINGDITDQYIRCSLQLATDNLQFIVHCSRIESVPWVVSFLWQLLVKFEFIQYPWCCASFQLVLLFTKLVTSSCCCLEHMHPIVVFKKVFDMDIYIKGPKLGIAAGL